MRNESAVGIAGVRSQSDSGNGLRHREPGKSPIPAIFFIEYTPYICIGTVGRAVRKSDN